MTEPRFPTDRRQSRGTLILAIRRTSPRQGGMRAWKTNENLPKASNLTYLTLEEADTLGMTRQRENWHG